MKIKLKYLLKRSIVKLADSTNKICGEAKIINSRIKIEGKNNIVTLEKGTSLKKGKISIKGDNNIIHIGQNCELYGMDIYMEDSNSQVRIGEGLVCAQMKIISQEGAKIEIGKGCIIGYDTEIRNTDSHKIFSKENGERINHGQDIIIGENVWIAMRCLILKGSQIGSGTVIGAGSIVKGMIDRDCIAVGVPAKKVKDGVFWKW